ncbi:hypothetical protein SPOG_05124 [Schizosaccharomyces cryophilus OY26]|uniref:Uncharacterized protein n=1 Tax=Schizosaccharomyces cryophilus (strain OY26 / ATCC MYA-4695 / CBS 11777 / NBRC 106824 / NRRL Y48691) TaxID=653667 RepID=S9VWH0_SCHCR|nr:uncharacterized protein SPOG_05124 [Schizosaccharomyces cryophilus OY26]EPY51988.1 hypothetical protein SPOG_05124 [Schizosaccharomyces cryophilus OY26]
MKIITFTYFILAAFFLTREETAQVFSFFVEFLVKNLKIRLASSLPIMLGVNERSGSLVSSSAVMREFLLH